jgi:hypothetical protein
MDWHDFEFFVLRLGAGLLLLCCVARLLAGDIHILLCAFLRILRLLRQSWYSPHRSRRRSKTGPVARAEQSQITETE